jgi:hypothetical protein
VEPIIVAAIAALGGLVSGLVVSLTKPWGENWLETQRARRTRRHADLDRLADGLVAHNYNPEGMRMTAASIGDPDLIGYVGRIIVASTDEEQSNARGDAIHRVGELRSKQ